MKKLLLVLLITSFSQIIAAQQIKPDSSRPFDKKMLLDKSKKQKNVAKILLITGGSLIVLSPILAIADAGTIIDTEGEVDAAFDVTSTIMFIGGLMSLTSIPIFIASKKNKRKALSLSFQHQKGLYLNSRSIVNKAIPAISVKVSF